LVRRHVARRVAPVAMDGEPSAAAVHHLRVEGELAATRADVGGRLLDQVGQELRGGEGLSGGQQKRGDRQRDEAAKGHRISLSVRVLTVLLPASSSTVILTFTRTRL